MDAYSLSGAAKIEFLYNMRKSILKFMLFLIAPASFQGVFLRIPTPCLRYNHLMDKELYMISMSPYPSNLYEKKYIPCPKICLVQPINSSVPLHFFLNRSVQTREEQISDAQLQL